MLDPCSGSSLSKGTVSSSTLGTVSRMHVDTPSCCESPGKRSLLSSGERAQSARQCLSLSEPRSSGRIARLSLKKGRSFHLEDERTRSIREDPRSVTTIGFGEGVQALTPRLLQSLRVRKFWYSS
jgi:hypothetical protein